MPKNSIKQIQKDEKKILNELSKNANKSMNDIAETCHFSRQKVWRIIRNMEKNNTIWGYATILDQEKLNKKEYLLLVKRTNKPISKKLINQIITRELEKEVKLRGIELIKSNFTHGYYDWIIHFTANNIKDAKGFIESFNRLYEEHILETHLIENMFTVVNCGITNPEIKKISEFFKI